MRIHLPTKTKSNKSSSPCRPKPCPRANRRRSARGRGQRLRFLASSRFFPMVLCGSAPASQGRRWWVANDAASCPWRSSCKSPSTLQKCKLLITRQLTFGAVLGEHKLSSPSTRLKVNHLCIRYLCSESVRGDLQEGHFYASRCNLSLCLSTKTSILCSKSREMGVPDPKKAQKPRFCARKGRKRGFQTPKAHKNAVFVLGRGWKFRFCLF